MPAAAAPGTRAARVAPTASVLAALTLAGAAWLVLQSQLGDYPSDAGPAVAALAEGSFRRAAAVPFLMGPLSILLRAPFAWAAERLDAGDLVVYRAGVIPCLLVAVALGLALARRRSALGAGSGSWPLVVPVLAVVSPASLAAVRAGHPEEALGGALCVAAVLLAGAQRVTLAGLALGLAVATKQWALIAAAPAVLAVPARSRIRLLAVGAVAAAVFFVPFVARDPHAFLAATRVEARVVAVATPESVWFAASHERQLHVEGSPTLTYHPTPGWVPPFSHALIVALAGVAALLLWRRGLDPARALALLALLFLARCALDPVDQDYFHLPFLLALLAWEVESRRLVRDLPVITIAAAACLWLSFGVAYDNVGPWLSNALYLAWAGAAALFLLARRGGALLAERA
jgi:hypothetical protein